MSLIKTMLRRLNELKRLPETNQEIEEELRYHIERRTQHNLASGMTDQEAESDALRRFGDYEKVKAMCLEISREKEAKSMKPYQELLWVIFGVGLTLLIASEIDSVRIAGRLLVWIAILWRVLIYLRSIQATRPHREMIEPSILGLSEAILPESPEHEDHRQMGHVTNFDSSGRTPVERMIEKDQ